MARRWPRWVYDEGEEPDPRFSFANERTFLAWVRTSLALLAGGVALQALPVTIPLGTRRGVSVLLVVLALATVAAGWVRWARSERAMRRTEALPGSVLSILVAAGVVVTGIVLLLVVATTP